MENVTSNSEIIPTINSNNEIVIDDTGTIMKGYINGIPSPVLSGGQYDPLMEKMHRRSRAIGFAVYINLLERVAGEQKDDGYLNVALPKGRLGDKVYGLFTGAGFGSPQYSENSRKLFFDNDEKRIRYFWVKPSDVSKYVERGAADIGVAGADILREYSPEVDELQDLHLGVCRMVVAGPRDFEDDSTKTLRIATKFTNIANKYYQSRGRNIDIIKLHGSIEIAPLLGLSDVIVDIVETGTTLKENNLRVLEEVMPISARLIANRSACKFKGEQIEALKNKLAELVEEKND